MVYIRTKVFEERVYRYLVKGVRINGLVKQKVVKYIGPVKPIYKLNKKRKTNASIYVKSITNEEKDKLSQALHSSNAFVRDRARIILHSSKKMSAVAVALKVDCEVRKVRASIKAFNKEGLKALERKKAKGAKQKFSKEGKLAILIHFSKSPREFGEPISSWTLPRFRQHLLKTNVVSAISIETLRQMLIKAGAKLTKSKRWQYSPDKNFLRKRKQ